MRAQIVVEVWNDQVEDIGGGQVELTPEAITTLALGVPESVGMVVSIDLIRDA